MRLERFLQQLWCKSNLKLELALLLTVVLSPPLAVKDFARSSFAHCLSLKHTSVAKRLNQQQCHSEKELCNHG